MPLSSLALVPMTPGHLEAAHALSSAVGWPHRVEDWAFVLVLGHGVVALDGGQIVGVALWWPMGADHATLGMVIVAPRRQGSCLGRRLVEAILDQAGGRCVLLNATREGLPLYEKLGFAPTGSVCQHQGVLSAGEAGTLNGERRLRILRDEDFAALRAFDENATGLDRVAVLRALVVAGSGLIYGREGQVEGYALTRPFGRGRVIGPVAATELPVAQALIQALIESRRGSFLRIDVPAESGLSGWLEVRGLAKVSEVVSMVRGAPPERDADAPRLYALASQALG